MKILVIGLGKSGRAAYELLLQEGYRVIGTDDNADLLTKLVSQGIHVDPHPRIEEFDQVVLSPGVPPTHPLYIKARELKKEIIGEAELALSRLQQPCIGITGTNGKTTVTLLTEHILTASGLKARALGNVGTPLTSYKGNDQEIMVVELSSFQLELMKTSVVDIGIILNITPDHLDRYTTMEEYAQAKCRLQNLMKSTGIFWVHQCVVKNFKPLLKLNYQTYGTDYHCTCWTDRTALRAGEKIETILPIRYRDLGRHESENVLAAWILCKKFGVSPSAFFAGLETFKKPAHRIEFVATLDGIDYFNDSKGTNIDATIKAVEAMTKNVILIAGGVDKGASYEPWKKSFIGKVKQVFAIGQASARIAQELKPEFEVEIVSTLQDAVECARRRAQAGMSILLSPGCSSYDMFRDYAHRGDEFKKFVLERRN
jgi:UDP-N-acetylmuramoylalanine--D-glutamate ligase